MYESICNISSIKGKDLLLHFSVSLALSIYLSFPQSLSVYVSGSLFFCPCLSVCLSVSLSHFLLSFFLSPSLSLLPFFPRLLIVPPLSRSFGRRKCLTVWQ